MLIVDAVLDRANARPDSVALATESGRVRWADLVVGDGIDHGSGVVALHDGDPLALLPRLVSTLRGGGVPLVLDHRWTAEHVAAVVAGLDPPPPMRAAWAAVSSGSTGRPRVVLREERSWSASFAAVDELLALRSDDRMLLPTPLSSSIALFGLAHALSRGLAVFAPARARDAALRALLPEATIVHTTPTMVQRVLDLLDAGAEHRLRLALVGGAELDDAQRARAIAHGISVVTYYGAAELSFVAVDRDGSGLRAFPGVEIRREPVPGGALARLWVRSPYLASGYLGADGALERSPEGWATVGDLVDPVDAADPERIVVRGRGDAAILTAAATVLPDDVERVLRSLPGVRDAAVFGEPTARVGALVSALIEADPAAVDLAAWRAECRRRLAPAQRPRHWYLTAALPRTAAGKVARAELERALAESAVQRLG
ncbi:MAG: AMP-binding protein [Microcella sp.]|uniref:class I adenylate-forming enzyme family protein n=1 Tax=Microcella sp. TaxID=1913979 RepID=UPI0027191B24|nr:AMP-binding protein [Microcella sp.]MDO8337680.1 AMP-binding protein [Microcella sp.]